MTPSEKHARFNGMDTIQIFRDGDSRGRLRWFLIQTRGDLDQSGFPYGSELGSDTLGCALSLAKAHFPSFMVYRTFLARVEGDKPNRLLHAPQAGLVALERGALVTDSQDIAAALEGANKRTMAALGMRPRDITGVVEVTASDEVTELWATVWRAPYNLDSIYQRVA